MIYFEPAYDSYTMQVKMAEGVPVPVVLELDEGARSSSGYRLDMTKVRAAWTPATKMIVLNSPCNPSGKLMSRDELQQIADFAEEKNLIVVSDEVYEVMFVR